MDRTKTIVLQVGDRKEGFEVSHAERILKMKDNGGWHLPEDSPFLMDPLNGLTSKRNKGTVKNAKKNSANT